MKIALAYNVKKSKPVTNISKQSDLEFDSPFVINSIKKVITDLGHSILMVEADEKAYSKILKNRKKIDLVFNIAEGLIGDARESQIPLFCEMLGIKYTHSSPTTHAIALNKHFCKMVVRSSGINTPKSFVVNSDNFKLSKDLKFPLFVKPNSEGSSKGVLDNSVVHSERDLRLKIKELITTLNQDVLVEEFIDGREFTVSIFGNDNPRVLPIIEQRFDFLPKHMNKIASFELKWLYEDTLKNPADAYFCPAKLSIDLQNVIEKTSIEIFKMLEVRDAARIDFRLDKNNVLYFLEINTLPGINPDTKIISYFPISLRTANISFPNFIDQLIKNSLKRYN